MTCSQAHRDGSYVLGALSPNERQEFEQHLAGCAECARSVRQLAGLPGLLARVDPEVLVSAPAGEPVPDTLLPALARRVRRGRWRRTAAVAGAAAAAAVLLTLTSLAVVEALDGDESAATVPEPSARATTVPPGTTMAPIGEVPVRGSLTVTSVPWGTRLDLTCSYPVGEESYAAPSDATYALVVQTRGGRTEQVATWRALPGRTMQVTAATAADRSSIALVEVRTDDGTPVLELQS